MPKKETPKNQSKTVDDFDEMPKVDDFKSLPEDLQKNLMEKFADEDTETEETEEEEGTESSGKPDEESESTDDTSEEEEVDWEKRYKDLQSAYTKGNEDRKDLVSRLAALEKGTETPKKRDDAFAKLIKDNPKAKDFIEGMRDAIDARMGDAVKPVTERLDTRDDDVNETTFREELDEFLEGDLKGLEPELDALISRKYGTEEKLITASRKDPNLFNTLKNELVSTNLDKVVEIKTKKSEDDPDKRNKDIKKLGVSGKSKTSAPAEEDDVELKNFKKLKTSDDMKAVLRKQGLVDKSAEVLDWK